MEMRWNRLCGKMNIDKTSATAKFLNLMLAMASHGKNHITVDKKMNYFLGI